MLGEAVSLDLVADKATGGDVADGIAAGTIQSINAHGLDVTLDLALHADPMQVLLQDSAVVALLDNRLAPHAKLINCHLE